MTSNVFTSTLSKRGDTIVKLRDGTEPPLIIIHGGLGSIHAFAPLKRAFSTTLWAIQVTRDTPRHSLEAQINFYYEEITASLANGPYRIGAFSASSIIAVGIVKLLESSGRTVSQLAFIDHFPTTFITPMLGVDLSVTPLGDSRARKIFLRSSINNLLAMTRADMRGQDPNRHRMADDLQAAYSDSPGNVQPSASALEYKVEVDQFLNRIFDFILSLHLEHQIQRDHSHPPISDKAFMVQWMQSVHAPVSVYLSTYGMLGTYAQDDHPPPEWHIQEAFKNVEVVILDAGHYDILSKDALHRGLQGNYLMYRAQSHL
ncbi:hypothetical protein D9619_010029 [Psilocybe cf. subviscida]|uniref:Thioesterase domain-containing protein n=1 Tax=Psilocybe cf. subviscida TaxID=2480587 RepID=A0A8H5F609_9AGAR|nr:hypothetical protein D9619_010029 [Psilocybe cf. subviscida]